MNRPSVEILAIGNELLLGETVDTNSPWIARRLGLEGIAVARTTLVGDDEGDIRAALAAALQRTGTVICTGGLGPTTDDLTRHAVAELYGRELTIDEEWVDVLLARYRRRGIEMPAINRIQAERPRGAMLLPNERGTAPGVVIDDDALGWTVMLPGVPHEMRSLMDNHVVALLRTRLRPSAVITSTVVRTTGVSEAALAERIADIAADTSPVLLAFLPQIAGVDLRLTCEVGADAGATAALERLTQSILDRLGPDVYAQGDADLAAVVGDLLRDRGLTIATAESCTGGLLTQRLTDTAGASDYLQLGWVTYANAAKRDALGVEPETLAMHGAVSEQCAREMAQGARRAARADVGVSITGIAGPGGGSSDKPVGTVWMAVALEHATFTRHVVFAGNRDEIRQRSAQAALDFVRRSLSQPDG